MASAQRPTHADGKGIMPIEELLPNLQGCYLLVDRYGVGIDLICLTCFGKDKLGLRGRYQSAAMREDIILHRQAGDMFYHDRCVTCKEPV